MLFFKTIACTKQYLTLSCQRIFFYLFIKLITVLYIPAFHLPCFLAVDPFPTLNRLQLNS